MRIDPAGNHDLAVGIDDALRANCPKTARRRDRYDLLAGNSDIDDRRTFRHDGDATGDNQIEHGVLPLEPRILAGALTAPLSPTESVRRASSLDLLPPDSVGQGN